MRAICAFLNSSGGLLIWGAPIEVRRDKGYKVCAGPLSPVEKRYSKDEFISKLSTKIIPFASPALFRSIEIEEGKYVYLFDVPESEVKPHQFDDRYFIRLDGQSKAAPHYVIDALFKQFKRPILHANLKATVYNLIKRKWNPSYAEDLIVIALEGSITNLSEAINDKNIFYIIRTDFGSFTDPASRGDQLREAFDDSLKLILPIGIPVEFSLKLHIRAGELINITNTLMLTVNLTAGGELSAPIKQTYIFYLQAILDNDGTVGKVNIAYSRDNPLPLE